MKWVWRYVNYVVTWREHRRVIKELNQLTNSQLKDVGLNRADIDRLVWLAEDKRKRGQKDNNNA